MRRLRLFFRIYFVPDSFFKVTRRMLPSARTLKNSFLKDQYFAFTIVVTGVSLTSPLSVSARTFST